MSENQQMGGAVSKSAAMRFPDPYEHLSEAAFARHVRELRQPHAAVSMRMPPTLLRELKAEAKRLGVPYQTLAKQVLNEHVGGRHRAAKRVL